MTDLATDAATDPRTDAMTGPILAVRGLRVHFPIRISGILRGRYRDIKAVDGVDFDLWPGETLGIVGESGCGKSTLARAVLQLLKPTAGSVAWMNRDIVGLRPEQMRQFRQDMQIVFQDPLASLDPRMTVGESVAEPLKAFNPRMAKGELTERVREMMRRVDLLPQMINRYPHEFSGGQCQRIGIARAMILNPRLIVCDEPVSALDVSIQAQIINLLMRLQAEYQLSLMFISHDLSVVRHISHRIMVLYMGRVMEIADRDTIYGAPSHPYTKALISAVPLPDPDRERSKKRAPLSGDPPSPLDPPSGCVFRTRCPLADARCANQTPDLRDMAPGHQVACHHS
jgi:oligopeptide transport system ATP-binding protein